MAGRGLSAERSLIDRAAIADIERALELWRCVALGGPRLVGKTTLARSIADRRGLGAEWLDLRRPIDRNRLGAQAEFFAENAGKLMILDHFDVMPEAADIILEQLDLAAPRAGQSASFLLAGLETDLARNLVGVRLRGRAKQIDVAPLQVGEVCMPKGPAQIESEDPLSGLVGETGAIAEPDEPIPLEQLWLRGGMPDSLLAETSEQSLAWRRNYLTSYYEVDLGGGGDAEQTRACLAWVAAEQGRLSNLQNEPRPFKARLKLLERNGLIRVLRPWWRNAGNRLVKTPKYYVRDSGLLHALRGRGSIDDVMATDKLPGASWEGFCIEAMHVLAADRAEVLFYRNTNKDEVDVVIEFPDSKAWIVELKLNPEANLRPGFHVAREDIKPERCFVVHSGEAEYTKAGDIAVLPLAKFLAILQERL